MTSDIAEVCGAVVALLWTAMPSMIDGAPDSDHLAAEQGRAELTNRLQRTACDRDYCGAA